MGRSVFNDRQMYRLRPLLRSMSGIKMEDRRPVWQHNCERCLACIHWCPCEAIEYGKKTVKRRRYHNPNIKIEDIKRGC